MGRRFDNGQDFFVVGDGGSSAPMPPTEVTPNSDRAFAGDAEMKMSPV